MTYGRPDGELDADGGDAPGIRRADRHGAAHFEAAIERIVEAIERRGRGAGAPLPNEGKLAAQLRISRPTLRQALRLLERANVLEVKKGQAGGVFPTTDLIPVDQRRARCVSRTRR